MTETKGDLCDASLLWPSLSAHIVFEEIFEPFYSEAGSDFTLLRIACGEKHIDITLSENDAKDGPWISSQWLDMVDGRPVVGGKVKIVEVVGSGGGKCNATVRLEWDYSNQEI